VSKLDEILVAVKDLSEIVQQQAVVMMNADQAAEYLGVSKAYLYRLTSGSVIPHYKPGGKQLYFDKAELNAYLKTHRIITREQVRKEIAGGQT
jgi:excisionase family DNA binding protein